ncbi:MAG: NADP-dependent oxidoreductase [Corynebacterium sp.]|nr:NADP-dependent oxidoreductase [Corynebacterium sp.]
MVETMRQAQLHNWGDHNTFEIAEVPIPEPTPGKLLIKTASLGINPVDWKTRAGNGIAGLLPSTRPIVLGWDIAGTVVSTGPDAAGFTVGDEVYGLIGFPDLGNAYAEYVCVKATDVTHIPVTMPLEDAGAVPLVALTAWQALFDIAEIKKDDHILIHAGAGGVGHVAIQLAVHAGATVYATASSHNHAFLSELGAIPVDYASDNYGADLPAFDVVLDTIGGQAFTYSLDLMAPSGIIISVPDPSSLDEARARGIRAEWVFVHPNAAQLRKISGLIDDASLRINIDRRYPLDEIGTAHSYGEKGHVRGKLVVNP